MRVFGGEDGIGLEDDMHFDLYGMHFDLSIAEVIRFDRISPEQ